ncbi:hypothetical protein GS966_20020 [Rhodococcus hoagii]|nr:hypothetical protein [Prescottella equi]NKS73134.1 hypothetical protein [Prescottella equi]NKZ92214.1 hypothetical protein [Prescottella equi]
MPDQVWVPADHEFLVKEHIKALLTVRGKSFTAGLGVPSKWDTNSLDHVQVGGVVDTIDQGWGRTDPIRTQGPTQITVWSENSTAAKALANLCLGLLIVARPPAPLTSISPIGGVFPARDEHTHAELAFFKVHVSANTVLG